MAKKNSQKIPTEAKQGSKQQQGQLSTAWGNTKPKAAAGGAEDPGSPPALRLTQSCSRANARGRFPYEGTRNLLGNGVMAQRGGGTASAFMVSSTESCG